jgi:WD40 repeat protein
MLTDDRLYDLLDEYRELHARGGEVTPAALGVDADTFAQLVHLHRRSLAIENRLAPVRVPDVRPGVSTDRYQTTRLLGSGGYGDVFRTDDRELGRAVALKVPRVLRAAPEEVNARLRAEAVLMGRLDHPGVPAVHSLGTDRTGRPFYTMRLIDGNTLADEISRLHLALPPNLTARAFGDLLRPLLRRFVAVCAAVAYAHSQGVLHRDLKPHNVMLGEFDVTLVMDWGLARAVRSAGGGEQAVITAGIPVGQTAGAVGTIGYIAPEQWAADPGIDHRADVYSLGAILYHLLAGRPSLLPAEIGEGFRAESVRPLRGSKAGLPPALVAVCEKAMAPDPVARYGSAEELSADVQAWLDDRPVAAYREPWIDRAARWTRRHRTGVSIAATAVPLLVALGVGAWLANGILGDAETRRTTAESAADTAREQERAAKGRERQSAIDTYPSVLSTIDGMIARGELDDADRLLDEQRAVLERFGERPGFEWGHRKAQAQIAPPFEFQPVHRGKVLALCHPDAFTPMMSVGEDGRLVRWDADTGRAVSVVALALGQTFGTTGFTFDPESGQRRVTAVFAGMPAALANPPVEVGDLFLAAGQNEQNLTPFDGLTNEQLRALVGGPPGLKVCYQFAKPDGSGRRAVTLTRVRGLQAFKTTREGVARFSRDGKKLALGLQRALPGGGGGTYPLVGVFDTATGDRLCEIPVPGRIGGMEVSALTFSPDGSQLLVSFYDRTERLNIPAVEAAKQYRVYDAGTGKEKAALAWAAGNAVDEGFGGAAFGPDGKRVFALGTGGSASSLGVWGTDQPGERAKTLLVGSSAEPHESVLGVSEDGRWVLAHGPGGAAVLSTGGGGFNPLLDLRGAVYAAAFDRSGRLLAAADADDRLVVWATDSLAPVHKRVLAEKAKALALAFAPDSRRVFVAQHFDITRYDLTGGAGAFECESLDRAVKLTAAAFHPNGEVLLGLEHKGLGATAGSIRRHDPTDGRSRGELVRHPLPFDTVLTAPTPNADGTRVAAIATAFAGDPPQVLVFDAQTAAVLHRFPLPAEMAEADSLAWLPGDTRLLIGEHDSPSSETRMVRWERVSFPRRAVVCDLTTGKAEYAAVTQSGVECLAVSPDGKHLIAADRTAVYVCDPVTFALRYRLRVEAGPITAVAASQDGTTCAIAFGADTSEARNPGENSGVMVFELADGSTRLPPVKVNDGLITSTALAFTPDGKSLVCGTTRGNVHLLDTATGAVTRTVRATTDPRAVVSGLFVPPSGKDVVVSVVMLDVGIVPEVERKRAARLTRYSLGTGERVGEVPWDETGPIVWPANADRSRVAVSDLTGGPVRVFAPDDWTTPVTTLRLTRPDAVRVPPFVALAASPDGKLVAGAAADGGVLLVSHPDGKVVRRWTPKDTGLKPAAVRFTPDGLAVVVAGQHTQQNVTVGRAVRLDVTGGGRTPLLDTPPLGTYAARANALTPNTIPNTIALSDDAATLVVPLDQGMGEVVAVYSLAAGKEVARHLFTSDVVSLAYHTPTATVVVALGNNVEVKTGPANEPLARWANDLYVWEVAADNSRRLEVGGSRWRPSARAPDRSTFASRLTLSPDGRTVAHRDSFIGTVRLTDLSTGSVVLTKTAADDGPLLFSPDGRTLLSSIDNGVMLYTSLPPK